MYTLTDLIKDGRAEINDKAGISIANVEKQMQIRAYPNSITLLRELRAPELVNIIKSWPGTPARYDAEEIIKDIETRHPKRKLVLSFEESKTFEEYIEAELRILEKKDGEWIRVPSALPGFFVPSNDTELTLSDEITRTVKYLGTKCLPDLFEQEIIPDKYEFSKFKILKVRHAGDRAGADIEVEIEKKPGLVKYSSIHKYWDAEIAPNLLSDKATPAAKKLMLVEFMRNFGRCYMNQSSDINFQKIRMTIHALENMLQKAIKEPEQNGMKEKTSYISLNKAKLETNDEKIRNAQTVYAKGLIESIIGDWNTIAALYIHDNEAKFNKGEPFKVNARAELVYES